MTTKRATARVNFDVPGDLKTRFLAAVEAKLSTPSLTLRDFMKRYVNGYRLELAARAQAAEREIQQKRR